MYRYHLYSWFLGAKPWDITDANGTVLVSGPNASGQIGACAVLGCTDPTAANYDPCNADDGSCIFCTDNWVTITCGGSFQVKYLGTS